LGTQSRWRLARSHQQVFVKGIDNED